MIRADRTEYGAVVDRRRKSDSEVEPGLYLCVLSGRPHLQGWEP